MNKQSEEILEENLIKQFQSLEFEKSTFTADVCVRYYYAK